MSDILYALGRQDFKVDRIWSSDLTHSYNKNSFWSRFKSCFNFHTYNKKALVDTISDSLETVLKVLKANPPLYRGIGLTQENVKANLVKLKDKLGKTSLPDNKRTDEQNACQKKLEALLNKHFPRQAQMTQAPQVNVTSRTKSYGSCSAPSSGRTSPKSPKSAPAALTARKTQRNPAGAKPIDPVTALAQAVTSRTTTQGKKVPKYHDKDLLTDPNNAFRPHRVTEKKVAGKSVYNGSVEAIKVRYTG